MNFRVVYYPLCAVESVEDLPGGLQEAVLQLDRGQPPQQQEGLVEAREEEPSNKRHKEKLLLRHY